MPVLPPPKMGFSPLLQHANIGDEKKGENLKENGRTGKEKEKGGRKRVK
jgi:hypothetical protein